MFEKILIANRGEIACRVIQSARAMGIKTVAVYSTADSDARHVYDADEAILIGAPEVSESYLCMDKIMDACKQTGAEAVHPGYGFLSENSEFASRLFNAGIIFIGPGASAIEVMGDKITSKLLAEKSGVNTIPGYTDVVQDSDQAVIISRDIGYPVMIKASAGGGGKGMRVAYNDAEAKEGFERATSEAISSFGDGRIFIEKFIEQPRHIEIQLIADQHGNVVALNERECSIQRRHQKIIEEAPSPFLNQSARQRMCGQAKALAQAIDYCSVGTVEFVMDANQHFYFLEMNTRLQVEHPVTEMITGLDLVELMIKVAAGEKLPFVQEDIKINGWAMEARVYAENPVRNFLPSIGRLKKYQVPEGENIRVDTGVLEGSEVSMFYDPMIAKLITWGGTRSQAISTMRKAISQYAIQGVDTNLPFLFSLFEHPRFKAGELTTDFIDKEYAEGFCLPEIAKQDVASVVSVLASVHYRMTARAATISNQSLGFSRKVSGEWVVILNDHYYYTQVKPNQPGWEVQFDGETYQIRDQWQFTKIIYRGQVNKKQLCMLLERSRHGYAFSLKGGQQVAYVMTPRTAELNQYMPVKQLADQSDQLVSPMPGLLISLTVSEGQEVKQGEELAVIEAMKMENSIRAETDVQIAKIFVKEGEIVEVDQPILAFVRP